MTFDSRFALWWNKMKLLQKEYLMRSMSSILYMHDLSMRLKCTLLSEALFLWFSNLLLARHKFTSDNSLCFMYKYIKQFFSMKILKYAFISTNNFKILYKWNRSVITKIKNYAIKPRPRTCGYKYSFAWRINYFPASVLHRFVYTSSVYRIEFLQK